MPPDPLGVSENMPNIPEIMLVTFILARIVSIPVGFGVFVLVRRLMRQFSMVWAGILLGWLVGFGMITALIVEFAPEGTVSIVDAAAISLIVTSGIVFAITTIAMRELKRRAATLEDPSDFGVFGESAKGRHHRSRRWR